MRLQINLNLFVITNIYVFSISPLNSFSSLVISHHPPFPYFLLSFIHEGTEVYPFYSIYRLGSAVILARFSHRSILLLSPSLSGRYPPRARCVGRSSEESTIGSTIDASRLVANPTAAAFRPDPSDLVRSVRVPWQRY